MCLKEICRVCLRSDGALSSLLDLIVPKFDSPSPASVVYLWKMFTKMLKSTNDNFPEKICADCLVEIQKTYSFMLKCKRSEDILKKMKNVEIRLKRARTVSILHEYDTSKQIKSENDLCPNNLRIRNGEIEWDDTLNGNDKKDTDRGQFNGIIDAKVYSQIEAQSEHTLIVQHEDGNLETELLDSSNCKDNVNRGEVSVIQDIKQEPELDISMEKDECYGIESEVESSTEIVACPGCLFECRSIETLEKHIVDAHMVGQMCKLCNQEFECSIIEHCSNHFLKSTNREDSIPYYVKNDTDEEPFNSESSSKTFKDVFTAYLRQNTGKQQLKCQRPFKCESCSKTFKWKQELLTHFRNHTGERPFKCSSCSKSFTRKQTLLQHLRGHSEERPFNCESCSKTFKCKQQLMEHSKCHTGERPFECKICSRTFQRKEPLMNHLLQHRGERPFKCENCTKTFLRKQALMEHLICHSGERPFKCENCSKSFLHKISLSNHLKSHNKNDTKVTIFESFLT